MARVAEDVGEILVRVQDDLHHLKEQLLNAGTAKGEHAIDIKALEQAIERTEEGLRQNADKVMYNIQNRVQVLPALNPTVKGISDFSGDKSPIVGHQMKARRPLKGYKEPNVHQQYEQYYSMSPGEQAKELHKRRIIGKPDTKDTRQVLEDTFGLPKQESILQKRPESPFGRVITGPTISSPTKLPARNRRDPQLTPPPIAEDDARKGILSLLERGLIPTAAKLTLEPTPVKTTAASLHHISEQYSMNSKFLAGYIDVGFNMAGVKLDSTNQIQNEVMAVAAAQNISKANLKKQIDKERDRTSTVRSKQFELPSALSKTDRKLPLVPPPSSPSSNRTLRFVINGGKVKEDSDEFKAFKKHFILNWGNILTVIDAMVELTKNYRLPVVFVNGAKLNDLAEEVELELRITKDMLLDCIENIADVMQLMNIPGRRFKGPDGDNIAAVKIQAYWRRHKDRQVYLALRRQKWAAGIIAMSWLMTLKLSIIRKQLKQRRIEELDTFRDLSNDLKNDWNKIKSSSHVVIHIPSLGYPQNIRDTLHEIPLLQNLQMARLCEIADSNVDVILISPIHLSDESIDYYKKLLTIATSNTSKRSITDRFKIIVPDAVSQFKRHNMCLSTRLKYSPKAMRRLKTLILGRTGYIVSGRISKDDLHIASRLNLPILGTEPDVAQLFSTKSGSRRIFEAANVPVPPGACDIYSPQQLYDELADLIVNNLSIHRWMLKIDNEFDGRGSAFCDIAVHLQCYDWIYKEAHRYGNEWHQKWAQESAKRKILNELPSILDNHCVIVNKRAYSAWEKFLEVFLTRGGVIQACPPSDSVTAVTVDVLINPLGEGIIMSLGDQIHAESQYRMWGLSIPQSSIDPSLLCDTVKKICANCYSKGIVGHVCLDFVTFIEGDTMVQELWAVDMKIWYSDTMAMSQLLRFITGGKLDPFNSTFTIPMPKKEDKKWRKKQAIESQTPQEDERFSVVSTKLFHSNMQIIHYAVFFQMCKAQGIGFDIREKSGSIFTIVDDVKRKNMGMLTVGDSLQDALTSFAKALSTIHQEISSADMTGKNNFKAAIEDIESILGITVENEDEENDS